MIVYILFCIVAVGIAALRARYAFAKVPTGYHADVYKSTGAELNDGTLVVFRAL